MELEEYAKKLKQKIEYRPFDPSHLPLAQDPTPWPKVQKPLFLEVGCGAGLHPIRFAQQNPGHHLIACERTKEKFDKFKRRVENHQLDNVTPIYSDAIHWLHTHIHSIAHAFEKIFILYPNPYPKTGHRNKRFLAGPSFELLLQSLKPSGLIELRSNELFYLEEAKYLAKNVWNLELVSETSVCELEDLFRDVTHFEKKYLKNGQDCRQILFQKKD
jgi:tRNA (guanine-N7-)-methyltransferase